MKTNFTNDLSGSYDNLDVVLVAYKGIWNWLHRFFTGRLFNTVFLVLRNPDTKGLGLYGVNPLTDKFQMIHPINQWKGILTSRKPNCTVINLRQYPETLQRALNSIGSEQHKDTYEAIVWIFSLETEKANEDLLIKKRIKK